jgi:hypothetical protein
MSRQFASRPRAPTNPQIKEHQGLVLAGETLALLMFFCYGQNDPSKDVPSGLDRLLPFHAIAS